jgi:ubiquinone/menaquinone biosynthesis C-methylase UbiE
VGDDTEPRHQNAPDEWSTRADWLASRRGAVIESYDAWAATFDTHPYQTGHQETWVARLLATCPPGSLVLDAPCGTGRYFSSVEAAGHRVIGIDQSAGMLEQAARRGIAESLEHIGLQEVAVSDRFDAIMTVDAMENVSPEDWPLVLANLRRALRPGGLLYLSVEERDGARVDAAYESLSAQGLPVVRGEVVEGGVSGYHYYPTREQVMTWVRDGGFAVVDEGSNQEEGWGYWHLLLEAR